MKNQPRCLAGLLATSLWVVALVAADDDNPSPAEQRAAVHWVAQEVATARVLDAVAQRAVRGPVLYRDISVVDVKQFRVVPHQSVLVADGKIAWVGDAAAAPVGEGAFVVEGAGLYLSPGLVDMHVHLSNLSEHLLHLACGNTTVRDMDGFPWILRLRRATQAGRLLAPTAYISGTIIAELDWGGYMIPVKTPAEARRVVDQEVADGYDFIKVHNRLRESLFDAVAEEARLKGKDLVGHVPHGISIDHAVHAGHMRTLEHLKGFIDDGTKKVSGEDYAAALKDATVWLTPTFTSEIKVFTTGDAAMRQLARPEMRYVSATKRANWERDANPAPDWRARLKQAVPSFLAPKTIGERAIASLPEAMARLLPLHPRWLAGTDSAGYNFQIPGYDLLEELLVMEKMGIARADVLRSVTTEPAIALRHEGEFGEVQIGQRADFVVLAGDPTKDLSRYHANRGVMVRGIWLDRTNLDSALEELARIKSEADEAFTLDGPKAAALAAEVQQLAARDIFLDPMELRPAVEGLRQLGFAAAAEKLQAVVSESAKLK